MSWTQPTKCIAMLINRGSVGRRLHVESVMVRTATGPGGRSGPLRVDLEHRYAYNVMQVSILHLP